MLHRALKSGLPANLLLVTALLSSFLTPVFATHAWAGYRWSYSDPAYHIDSSLYNLNMVDGSNPASLVNTAASKWNGFSNFYLHQQDGSWGHYGSSSLPSGILAETITYTYPFTKTIYNSITNFNVNKQWASYDGSSSNPPVYSLVWVGTHESGHWVKLEDISDTSSVMHYSYYSGYASVDSHSKDTVRSIYG